MTFFSHTKSGGKKKMKRLKLQKSTGINEDCWILIFSYLFTKEIINLRQVCKLFDFITRQSIVWKLKLNNDINFEKYAKIFEPIITIPHARTLNQKTKEIIKHSTILNTTLEDILNIINILRLAGYYGIGFRIKRMGDSFEYLHMDQKRLNSNNTYIIEKTNKTFVLKLKDINDIHLFNGNDLSFDLKSFFIKCEKIHDRHKNEIFKEVTSKMEKQKYRFCLEFISKRRELYFYIYWGDYIEDLRDGSSSDEPDDNFEIEDHMYRFLD